MLQAPPPDNRTFERECRTCRSCPLPTCAIRGKSRSGRTARSSTRVTTFIRVSSRSMASCPTRMANSMTKEENPTVISTLVLVEAAPATDRGKALAQVTVKAGVLLAQVEQCPLGFLPVADLADPVLGWVLAVLPVSVSDRDLIRNDNCRCRATRWVRPRPPALAPRPGSIRSCRDLDGGLAACRFRGQRPVCLRQDTLLTYRRPDSP